MWLLIDLGNSALKWRLQTANGQSPNCVSSVASGRIWLHDWDLDNASRHWQQVSAGEPWQGILIASVGKPAYVQQLRNLANKQQVPIFEAVSKPHWGDLANGYQQPEQLGVDRWLAMVAVFAQGIRDFCVIDCGTATTVDYVRAGHHQGGYIMPSTHLMNQTLVSHTQHIQLVRDKPCQGYATNTTQAVMAGTDYMHKHALTHLVQEAMEQGYQVLITGGAGVKGVVDMASLEQTIAYPTDLVLEGLWQVFTQDESMTDNFHQER